MSLFNKKSENNQNNLAFFGNNSNSFGNNSNLFSVQTVDNSNLISVQTVPKKRNNKKKINSKFVKCTHNNKYCAFCPDKEIGLICYDCIYKYNLDKSKCISMTEDFNYYKSIYHSHFNKVKEKIKSLVDSLLKEIEIFEKDTFDNISELFAKIDLNFSLPIEVPLVERLKIGINKKFSKIIYSLHNIDSLNNYLNLYETEIKDLKKTNSNPYNDEIITIKSEIPFTLKGIGLIKIPKELKNSISIKLNEYIYKNSQNIKTININLEESEENDLTIGRLEHAVIIEKDKEYYINISGIKGCSYIDDTEEFNIYNKIFIESDKGNNILTCLIVD